MPSIAVAVPWEKCPELLNTFFSKLFHKIGMYPVFHFYQGYRITIEQGNVKFYFSFFANIA
jgi:hypothetical protein